jgi:hypothetical protein
MTNKDKILAYLRYSAPNRITNGELRQQTGIASHQQVYMLTQELIRLGQIQGARIGSEWCFWSPYSLNEEAESSLTTDDAATGVIDALTHATFETLAQRIMGQHFGVTLTPGQIAGVPKQFDLVSADGRIVGDAKYYTLVRGEKLPPAKFATIAEYVWLLEKSGAEEKFLVFGHDDKVPRWWLRKYGGLVDGVVFYFLADDGTLEQLTSG